MLRVDDLDGPRVLPGIVERQLEDLRWLGFRWDEGPGLPGVGAPYTQSECGEIYRGAIAKLMSLGLVYLCDCSRKEIASLASAPHEGDDLHYPGTCRDKEMARPMKRAPSLRLRVDERAEEFFTDARLGTQRARVSEVAGDLVLQRGDGIYSYQLACAVDDGRSEITDLVRGEDLLRSTFCQRYLQRLLAISKPSIYVHIPLIRGVDGERLAKRHGAPSIRQMRELGRTPEQVLGKVAYLLGMVDEEQPRRLDALAADARTLAHGDNGRRA